MKTEWITNRRVLGFLLACALAGGIWSLHAQPASPNFTGKVTRLTEDPPGQIAYIHFEPGARTKWHIHEKGQIILVEDGIVLEQRKGGPIREYHAGEAIWCPPGVAHWHGAAPDMGGTQYNVTRGSIQWLDPVTDQEYGGEPVRN